MLPTSPTFSALQAAVWPKQWARWYTHNPTWPKIVQQKTVIVPTRLIRDWTDRKTVVTGAIYTGHRAIVL